MSFFVKHPAASTLLWTVVLLGHKVPEASGHKRFDHSSTSKKEDSTPAFLQFLINLYVQIHNHSHFKSLQVIFQ